MKSKFIAAAAVALFATAYSAAPTYADDAPDGSVTADHDPARDPSAVGFSQLLNGESAGVGFLQVEAGDTIRAICIQFGVPFPEDEAGITYVADSRSDARVASADQVSAAAWLVRHMTYTPAGELSGNAVGTPINEASTGLPAELLPAAEAAATQLAIWKYANGTDISAVDSRIQDRANELAELMADPNNRIAEGAHDFTVAASLDGTEGDVATLSVTSEGTFGSEAAPIAGISITVTSDDVDLDPNTDGIQNELEAKTDTAGVFTLEGLQGVDMESSISVAAMFVLPRGTVLTPGDGDDSIQQIISVDPARVNRLADASNNIAPAPTTTTAPPTTTVPEETTTTTVPEETTTTVPEETTTTVPEETTTTVADTTTTTVPGDLPKTGGNVTFLVLVVGAAAGIAGITARRKAL